MTNMVEVWKMGLWLCQSHEWHVPLFPHEFKKCKQLNICEHMCPAVPVTSRTDVWSWHHWQIESACLWLESYTRSHMLTAFSEHYSQTAYYRPRSRYILQLWCHHCETEGLRNFLFLLLFPHALTHKHSHAHFHRCHAAMTSPQIWVTAILLTSSHSLWSQGNRWWLIDWLQMTQSVFKLHSVW